MTKIKRLSTEIVSRIAAGEVVERPMNIVKELIENSIDAGSSQIIITISDGGRELIKLQDNGTGISVDELQFAFELHTTSKLETDDPSIVESLGFRGEALASIAAVSRIEVISKTEDDNHGRKLVLEGGKVMRDESVPANEGTSIQVTGIFFNTPARRKFLKAASTERKRITDLITNYCLMYPQIHFKMDELTSTGTSRRVESPSRKSMMAVIFDVLGAEVANDLIPFDHQIGNWDIKGYISKPSLSRSDRSLQFINVNGRPVRHKLLQSTIEDTYGSQLMRKTHPVLILKFNGPIDAIDFNIHPQKSEIRFQNNETMIDAIPEKILNSLSEEIELPQIQRQKLENIKRKNLRLSTSKNNKQTVSRISDINPSSSIDQSSKSNKEEMKDENKETSRKPKTIQQSLINEPISENFGFYQVLGHIMNKFGLIFADNELWIMDVHAADERVKFESFANNIKRKVSSQQFLEPVEIELSPSEKQLVLDQITVFDNFGLKISNSIANSLLIHSMPVYYDQEITPTTIQELLIDIITHINDDDSEKGQVQTPLEIMEYNIIARLACHGSIRSGYPVSNDKINQILTNLLKCEYPWTCAHGRPTILRLPKSRLESLFKR